METISHYHSNHEEDTTSDYANPKPNRRPIMAVDKEARRKAQELQKLLTDRMSSEGHENLRKFHIGSRIPLSPETVRRAFTDTDYYKAMEPMTLVIICQHLNFKPDEIREILANYTDDKYLHKMIGKQPKETLSVFDEAVLAAVREIVKASPESTEHLANGLEILAWGAGVDIGAHTGTIRRRKAV